MGVLIEPGPDLGGINRWVRAPIESDERPEEASRSGAGAGTALKDLPLGLGLVFPLASQCFSEICAGALRLVYRRARRLDGRVKDS
ncbi:MAG: hypothetical protein DRI90_14815, partial [Deltaproteobacteria bacterium]